jgi:alpha-beta hydrolase superfamily lysophospholipase
MMLNEFSVAVADHHLRCQVAAPDHLAQVASRPAVLLSFSTTRQTTLQTHPYAITAEAFTAAGHYVVSFDLPNHGDGINAYGEGLVGLWTAQAAGADPFGRFIEQGRAVIDACLQRGWGSPDRIFVCGVSRGGYCALRLMAADTRIKGGAALAPLVDWRSLSEFAAVWERPELAGLSLEHWVDQLAGRAIYIAVGNHDHRVGTERCLQFALRLFEAEASHQPGRSGIEVYINHSPGHTLDDEWAVRGAEFLLRLCEPGETP